MATASCTPGLRPEPGATRGEITVCSMSELVLWGPTQEPQEPGLLRGAWSGTPTRRLGRPSRRTARLLQRLSQRTGLTAESWLEARGSRSCPRHTWGKFRGHCRSRSRDVSSVAVAGGSSRPEERRCGSGSCSSLGIVLCGGLQPSWVQRRPLTGPLMLPRPPAEQRLHPTLESHMSRYSWIPFADFVGCSS